jgi:hypothetical protein
MLPYSIQDVVQKHPTISYGDLMEELELINWFKIITIKYHEPCFKIPDHKVYI